MFNFIGKLVFVFIQLNMSLQIYDCLDKQEFIFVFYRKWFIYLIERFDVKIYISENFM